MVVVGYEPPRSIAPDLTSRENGIETRAGAAVGRLVAMNWSSNNDNWVERER